MPSETMQSEVARDSPWKSFIKVMEPRGDFVGRPFHLQFKAFALSQSVTGVIPVTLFLLHGPVSMRLYFLMFLAFKISLGSMTSAGIISRYFPIWINEDAIRARNLWGMARVVPYDDMARVVPIRWLIFTRFAKISTHQYKNWVWLPLFLNGQGEFEKQVCQFAPADNPLRRYFEAAAVERSPLPGNRGEG
jgi:hypothetical protein